MNIVAELKRIAEEMQYEDKIYHVNVEEVKKILSKFDEDLYFLIGFIRDLGSQYGYGDGPKEKLCLELFSIWQSISQQLRYHLIKEVEKRDSINLSLWNQLKDWVRDMESASIEIFVKLEDYHKNLKPDANGFLIVDFDIKELQKLKQTIDKDIDQAEEILDMKSPF